MLIKHPDFLLPDTNTEIRRYLTMPKFLDLISTSTLHFCHIDSFFDKNEGKLTYKDKAVVIPALQGCPYDERFRKEPFDNLYFVNCWTIGDENEDFFWKTYVNGSDGVAIKTTMNRLECALFADKTKHVYGSQIQYINREEECSIMSSWYKTNYLGKCFSKGEAFLMENELRLLHIGENQLKHDVSAGVRIKVDLCTLIDEIIVSPVSPPWFCETVRSLLLRLNVGKIYVTRH